MIRLVLALSVLFSLNAFAGDTITIESRKIVVSEQLNMVKIHDPVFRISDIDIFGFETLYPAINSIDSTPSNGYFTAEFICKHLGYGDLLGLERMTMFSWQPVLRFMDSSDLQRTTFFVYPGNSHLFYEMARTVVCRLH